MKFSTCLAFIFATSLGLNAARAEIVEIEWKKVGAREVFSHEMSLVEKKVSEVCGDFKKGDLVKWRFAALAPLDFNIHYHEGKKVEYLALLRAVRADENTFTAPIDQTYCWMWTNTGKHAASFSMSVSR
jgi:hypothetical protein